MKKIYEFLNHFWDKGSSAAVVPEEDNRDAVKMPLFKIVFGPEGLFIDRTCNFFAVAGIYALLLSVLSLVAGQGYMCLYNDYRVSGGYCTNSIGFYVAVHIVVLYVISMFMVRWYNVCFGGQPLSWRYLSLPRRQDVRSFAGNIAFILINLLSMLSLYLLYVRDPNPDWRIELVYFAFVSIGFLVPFVVMRFYALIGFILAGEKFPSFAAVWNRGRGNSLRILVSLALIFFLTFFSLFAFLNNFKLVDDKNAFYISFIVEYLYNLLLLLLVVFFTNHCYLQKTFLFGRNQDGE